MKHSLSIRLLGVMSGVLFSMGAYALDSQPPYRPAPVQKAPAATIVPQGAGDAQLGMAMLAARVGSTGTLISGSGAVSAQEFSGIGFAGSYEVVFNRNVTGCFYSATPFNIITGAFVAVQPREFQPNAVFLRFRNAAGATFQTEFYLTVYCAR